MQMRNRCLTHREILRCSGGTIGLSDPRRSHLHSSTKPRRSFVVKHFVSMPQCGFRATTPQAGAFGARAALTLYVVSVFLYCQRAGARLNKKPEADCIQQIGLHSPKIATDAPRLSNRRPGIFIASFVEVPNCGFFVLTCAVYVPHVSQQLP